MRSDPIFDRFPPRSTVTLPSGETAVVCGHRYSRSGAVDLIWLQSINGVRIWLSPSDLISPLQPLEKPATVRKKSRQKVDSLHVPDEP